MRRYYFKRGGKKVYSVPNTVDAITNKAKQEADTLGRAVVVFYEDVVSGVAKGGKAATKVYARNPAKKSAMSISKINGLMGEGKRAARAGKPASMCPYKYGTPSAKYYLKGYWKEIGQEVEDEDLM